jgi:hypothetical protein
MIVYRCPTCQADVLDTRNGILLQCPQHPDANIASYFVRDDLVPEILDDEEDDPCAP